MKWTSGFRRRRWERNLHAELRFHLEQQIADYVSTGLSPEEARRRAYLKFGAVELTKDECRDQRPFRWLADLIQDTRYAVRAFARSPSFTMIAILTLALGVGANTAMFTLIHRVLLKTLPVSAPEQLVEVGCINTNEPDKVGCNTSYPGFRMYRDNNQVFSGLFAFAPAGELNTIYKGEAELAMGLLATGDMYNVLGVSPALGRLLNPSDDALSAPPVAVLSHSYWQRRFGGDPRVIGQTLRLNTHAVTVIGVTPAEFRGITLGTPPDLTLPIGLAEIFRNKGILETAGNWWLRIIGRRKEGISVEQVQASLEPIFQRTLDYSMASLPPEFASRIRGYVSGMRFRVQVAAAGGASEFRRDLDHPLRILMAVVSFVLLIACANLASLLLSRITARRREFGVRLAIGAGRSRLARQLLTESLLLSAAGGAAGLVIAQWSGSVFLRMASGEIGLRAVDLKPDVAVFLFTITVTLIAGVLIGLAPILHLTKTDPQMALRDVGGKRASSKLARFLIPAQVALATILLIGAGLLLRTFENFRRIDLGFRSDRLITLRVSPGMAGYDAVRTRSYLRELTTRLEGLAGVRSVTFSTDPLGALGNTTLIDVPGFESAAAIQRTAGRNRVGPRFIETAGLKLLRGRDFGPSDNESSPRIAIVNESFARHFFRTIDAIGRQFAFAGQKNTPYVIVGVTADALDRGPKSPVERVVYTLFAQEGSRSAAVALRAQGPETALLASVRDVVMEIDRNVPVHGIQTMDARIDEALRRERLLAVLGTLFGCVALLLVAIGIFGVLAGAVARRTNEIGIRMALGAARTNVLWIFLREGLTLISIGLAVGLVGGMYLTQFMGSQLFGVTPGDPATFAFAAGVIITVAAAATLIPARRASRTDPIVALRREF